MQEDSGTQARSTSNVIVVLDYNQSFYYVADVFYSVKVYTGDLPAAGTDASIFITLFGETGNTCKRTLTNPNSPLILEKGQVSTVL